MPLQLIDRVNPYRGLRMLFNFRGDPQFKFEAKRSHDV